MTFEDLMQTAQKLNISVEALAALAARLLADTEGIALDAEVERSLDRVTTAMGITADELASVTADQRRAVTGMIRSFFWQAADLIDHPDRPPGWSYEDPVILQSQGRGSMGLVPIIQRIAADLGDLGTRLSQPGAAFLDVGTGVGWLAVGMAQAFKNLHVVGIDVWPPALRLAAVNIAGVKERIELREQDVTLLSDDGVFDAVFLPGPFLPKPVVEIAVERARIALRPGAWLLFWPLCPDQRPAFGAID